MTTATLVLLAQCNLAEWVARGNFFSFVEVILAIAALNATWNGYLKFSGHAEICCVDCLSGGSLLVRGPGPGPALSPG